MSLKTPTRTSSIAGTEPETLFGDPSGASGIDLAGWSVESITLLVTDLVFIYGFDSGAYTNIAVQGIVTIEYGGTGALDAGFSAVPVKGAAPLTVQFTDQSTGTVHSRYWSFGDGGSSGSRNPSHTYTKGGSYTVTLTVTGPAGTDTETRTGYITVTPGAGITPGILLLLRD